MAFTVSPLTTSCGGFEGPEPEQLTVQVEEILPHDRRAYTQGLVYYVGKLYESTGKRGFSKLRRVDPKSGRVEKELALDSRLFGEGLERVDSDLFQLTWEAGKCIVYDLGSFDKKRTLAYKGEGWGLCWDGNALVMSDGSDVLTRRSAETFQKLGDVSVTLRGRPVEKLNELEYVDGSIYANIWQEDRIVRIDPKTGHVTAEIDLRPLYEHLTDQDQRAINPPEVLNGIAWDTDRKAFYLTGKWWPKTFVVTFVPKKEG